MHAQLTELVGRFAARAAEVRSEHRTFSARLSWVDATLGDDSGGLILHGEICGQDFGVSWSGFGSHELHRDVREIIEQMAAQAAHTKAAGYLPGAIRLVRAGGAEVAA